MIDVSRTRDISIINSRTVFERCSSKIYIFRTFLNELTRERKKREKDRENEKKKERENDTSDDSRTRALTSTTDGVERKSHVRTLTNLI